MTESTPLFEDLDHLVVAQEYHYVPGDYIDSLDNPEEATLRGFLDWVNEDALDDFGAPLSALKVDFIWKSPASSEAAPIALPTNGQWTRSTLLSDKAAIDSIAALLSGEDWSPDTLDDIADTIRQAGREISELPDT